MRLEELIYLRARAGGGAGPNIPLVLNGRHANQKYVSTSNFEGFRYFIDGHQAEHSALNDRYNDIGIKAHRVFGQFYWDDGGRVLDPRAYGDRYYSKLRDYGKFIGDAGQKLEFNVFTAGDFLPCRQDHFDRCCNALDGLTNVVVHLGNEQDGYDPQAYRRPGTGLYVGRGSALGDEPPPLNEWDMSTTHPARNGDDRIPLFVKSCKAVAEAYRGDLGQGFPHYEFKHAMMVDEPIALGESSESGRTTSIAEWAWQMAGFGFMCGAFSICAHWRPNGLQLPGPVTEDCMRAMVEASQLPLGNCFEGEYLHTGSGALAIFGTDRFIEGGAENPAGTMDSYEFQDGHKAEHAALVAGPDYEPRLQNGWMIADAFGFRGGPARFFTLER